MQTVVKIDGVYVRYAQRAKHKAVYVRANRLWYLVPVQAGGWALRQILTRKQVQSSVPTLLPLSEYEGQRILDFVREPLVEVDM